MPFERNLETGEAQFSFKNLLALLLVLIPSTYFYWISFQMTKKEVQDNPTLQQITIVMVGVLTTVLNYFFGSSSSSAMQAQQIKEMQKTATAIALDKTIVKSTEVKIDKAVKIAELKAELEKHPPDSEEALSLLAQLKELEKKD